MADCDVRIWKCPECRHVEEIGYDWLAAHGGPVCQHCDCDMSLQPETAATATDHAAIVARLIDKGETNGLTAEDLDDLVHELASSIAADINNGGLDEQLGFLVKEMGVQATEKQLDQLIVAQPRGDE